jgi:hypothetical protein
MPTANLPVRFELSTTGSITGTVSAKHICTSITSEGGQESSNFVSSVNTDAIGNEVSINNTALILLRPLLTYNGSTNRGTILPTHIEILAVSGQSLYWSVVRNPTIVGSPTWNLVYQYSIAEYSITSGITVTGGRTIASGFAVAGVVKEIEYPDSGSRNETELSLDMTGTIQDVVAVIASPVSGTVPSAASISWKEYR